MTLRKSTNFRDYYNDDNKVSPETRARVEFEVELIGKMIEARELEETQEQKEFMQYDLSEAIDAIYEILTPIGYKLAIVPSDDRKVF